MTKSLFTTRRHRRAWDQSEGSDPEIETVNHEGMEENSNAEYVKMELPHQWTMWQRTMKWKVAKQIQHAHQAWGPEIMASWLQYMYLELGFSSEAARLLTIEHGLDSHYRPRVLADKNVDNIWNVVRKQGSKICNGMPNREQQVSVIAQKNIKLAAFLFHNQWRCIFD